MFRARKPDPDHVASTVAFALLLASWGVVYAVLCPPAPHNLAAIRLNGSHAVVADARGIR